MDDSWLSLPQGAVLVCAGVLAAGVPAVASAQKRERGESFVAELVAADVSPADQVAPTCGPCCHGSGGPECGPEPVEDIVEPDEPDLEEDIIEAPTCGPCCHGGGGPECEEGWDPPPPIPPAKQGCATADLDDSPGSLALLGAGLVLAGLGRRRRES